MPAGVSAYVPLANITLGSVAAIVTFSSISASYRDVVLVINGKATVGSGLGIFVILNSDFGNNYNEVYMMGSTAANSGSSSNAGAVTLSPFDSNDGNYVVNFMDYSATDKHKTFLSRNNIAQTETRAMAHRWANTSAINSIRVSASASTFVAGTTMALYGVSA